VNWKIYSPPIIIAEERNEFGHPKCTNLKDSEQGLHSPLTEKLLSKNRLHDNIHQSSFTIVFQCSYTSDGNEYCSPIVSQKKVCHYSYL